MKSNKSAKSPISEGSFKIRVELQKRLIFGFPYVTSEVGGTQRKVSNVDLS